MRNSPPKCGMPGQPIHIEGSEQLEQLLETLLNHLIRELSLSKQAMLL